MVTQTKRRWYSQLWFWVLVAIAAGILFGLVDKKDALHAKWLADAFIQLIKVVTAPVIFCTVVVGIASLTSLAKAGRLALAALSYFLVGTIVALTLGLIAGNLIGPGRGFHATASASAQKAAAGSIKSASGSGGLVGFITNDLLPTSILGPFVENAILPVLVLAILTATSISLAGDPLRTTVVKAVDAIAKVIFGIIRLIMWVAPLGAFGGMAYTVAQFGTSSLRNLLTLMVTFWGTCAVFIFLIVGGVARLSGFSIFKFVRLIKDELLIIVGTSSSETVLPRLLAKTEAAGASAQTAGLVIPTGYSFNLDGTCIYLTLGALFITQASGDELPIGTQIGLCALMVLTSKGAAGITGAGLVTLAASLQAFGGTFFDANSIAVGIALVVGIDRVMSEGRALTNFIGNGVATMVLAKWAGERDDVRFHAALNDPREINAAVDRGTLVASTAASEAEPVHTG